MNFCEIELERYTVRFLQIQSRFMVTYMIPPTITIYSMVTYR